MRVGRLLVGLLLTGLVIGLLAEPATESAPAAKEFTSAQKRWWAFQPVSHPAPPAFAISTSKAWATNE
ncbi:MAG: hypothetical protein R2762_13295, partial [Bryobacteraceae bacterium]